MKQNNSDEVLLNSSSMSIAINETPKSNKGPLPDSPYDLPATQMQEGRQMRRRNSVADLREGDQKTTKPPVQRQNVTFRISIYYILLFIDGYLLKFYSFNKRFNVTVNT
jgi:hypothetical protein